MPAGRPTELTEELQEAFLYALRRVWFIEQAAEMVGVHRTTVYRWIKRGRQEEQGKYAEFRNAVKKGLTENQASCLDGITTAGKAGSWQALAWLLERRYPEKWGNVDRRMRDLERQAKELAEIVARQAAIANLRPPQANGTHQPSEN